MSGTQRLTMDLPHQYREVIRGIVVHLSKEDVVSTVHVRPEHICIRGNYIVSGDDEFDREQEDKVLEELEYNEWAWCTVEVRAELKDFPEINESAYLGACSYSSEEDFKGDIYYETMKDEAFNFLCDRVTKLSEVMCKQGYIFCVKPNACCIQLRV